MDRSGTKRRLSKTEMVANFHKAFNIPFGPPDAKDTLDLRLDLLLEEVKETWEAAGFEPEEKNGLEFKYRGDPEKLLKELCDVVYVAVGWAVTHGWDFDEAFRRVHASNMTKIPKDGKIRRREDGKILKPPDYTPPELGDLV